MSAEVKQKQGLKSNKYLNIDMLTTKLRKFQFTEGKIIMTTDHTGDFIHINDLELWLREKKRLIENMRSHINKGEDASDWDKRYDYGLENQIEIIDQLINEI